MLARYQFTVTDPQGNVVPNANVVVRREIPGAPLAALKSDRDGAEAMTNPFQADANGFAYFHVVGGFYSIKSYLGAPDAPTFQTETLRYVAIGMNSGGDGIGVRTERVVTAAGDVVIATADADDIVIKKDVPEETTVELPDAAATTRDQGIVDGAGNADAYPIHYKPKAGQKLYGIVDYVGTIDGKGGKVILTPRKDGSGWH